MEILSHNAGKWIIQTSTEHWRIDAFFITDHHLSISITGSREVWDSVCQMDEAAFTNFVLGCI